MRYKIAFALPWLPQKNVENAHSHFAFAGWLTLILMVLMVRYLGRQDNEFKISYKKYNWLLTANLLTAWGMLLSFPVFGYNIVSIVTSTLSVFASYAFAIAYWRDLNKLKTKGITHNWFKMGLVWNVLSSVGPFYLAFMLFTGTLDEHWYLAAIYFFLHFQYNGWFFFACAGLLFSINREKSGFVHYVFYLFAFSCLPAYLLSVLWAKLPTGAYGLVTFAVILQLVGWIILLWLAFKGKILSLKDLKATEKILFMIAALAGTVKFLLQAGSLHPGLAKIAYGFRPIVIAYLHLIFLGMLTMYILAYLKHTGLIHSGSWRRRGISIFVGGIVFQEVLLLIQGLLSIFYFRTPYINELLLLSAAIMLGGIGLLNAGMWKRGDTTY
ncbi:MAG: hypothetical protein ABI378_00275 [Chitinophagaceae bacterium]